MKFNNIADIKKGVFFGALSGLTWGMDTVFIGMILGMAPFISNPLYLVIGFIVGAFLHDMCSAGWMFMYIKKRGLLKEAVKSFMSKGGMIIALASLMGGPLGMTGYLLGIKYSGPAYTATFSAVYPAIGSLFAHFILKEKLCRRAWSGIIISIIGIIGLGYSPIDLVAYPDFKIGIIFILVCVFGWALESVIVAYGMKFGNIRPDLALFIRQGISFMVYGIIIIPLIAGIPLVREVLKDKVFFLLIITALFGTISYLVWYKSIELIGSARATILNITYMVWAIILQVVIFKTELTINFILFTSVIILGVTLVIGNPKKMMNLKEIEN